MTSASRLAFFLATILLLSGCGLYWNQFGPELHLYDGPKREAHEVATIDQGAGCYTCVKYIRRFDQKDPTYTHSTSGFRDGNRSVEIKSPGKEKQVGDLPRQEESVLRANQNI